MEKNNIEITFHNISNFLGFKIIDDSLYQKALQLSSKSRKGIGNDRLEFLGDSILNLIISEYLFREKKKWHSGQLTELKSKLTNGKFLNSLSNKCGLKKFVDQNSRRLVISKKAYGDVLEALIAAIYLDKGFLFCSNFVLGLIQKHQDISELEAETLSYKHILLQKCNKYKISYRLFHSLSQDLHTVVLTLGVDNSRYTARALSLKEAEEIVCKEAFIHFKFEKKS